MQTLVVVLVCSLLGLCPVLSEAGTTGEQRPEQKQLLTKENLKLVQTRLQAEGVYAGPVDGELNAQTEAARRMRRPSNSCRSTSPPAVRSSGDATRWP